MNIDAARELLVQQKQEHLLRYWDELDTDGQQALLGQIETLNFDAISRMQQLLKETSVEGETGGEVTPVDVVELAGEERKSAIEAGEDALRAGEVGVILVAGGQGSRLGYDGPKGCYPVGPVSDCPLFEIHARKILALEKKYGADVPWYIMTSQANNADTVAFFKANDFFGLCPERVMFFVQGMWPALDPDGKIMLDARGHIFMSPDGHGGTISALADTGMLDDMAARGLKTLFYFQVDNPLVEVADPAFIGLHAQREAEISLKLCAKRDPMEGLGVPVMQDDRCRMVEYTELTDEQRFATREDGKLLFLYGSVAIHVFSYDFLKQESQSALPLHVAHKKVPFCDESGRTVKPDTPNAYKFEKFIFDVMPDADCVLNVAFAREEEFSPVKNAEGADSPVTCRRDLSAKWARWLAQCGVTMELDEEGFPVNAVEIDPVLALGPDDLKNILSGTAHIKSCVLLR